MGKNPYTDVFFSNNPCKKKVVVSHHAPSIRSLTNDQKQDKIYSAYASNLEELIVKHKPKYWIHGHLHTSQNYKIEYTTVISNPRGYASSPNPNFVDSLIIKV